MVRWKKWTNSEVCHSDTLSAGNHLLLAIWTKGLSTEDPREGHRKARLHAGRPPCAPVEAIPYAVLPRFPDCRQHLPGNPLQERNRPGLVGACDEEVQALFGEGGQFLSAARGQNRSDPSPFSRYMRDGGIAVPSIFQRLRHILRHPVRLPVDFDEPDVLAVEA